MADTVAFGCGTWVCLQMLGHARLSTTEIYTHVNSAHLVDVHRRSHPAEQRLRPGGPGPQMA
jgi:site-specific recombinase XerD